MEEKDREERGKKNSRLCSSSSSLFEGGCAWLFVTSQTCSCLCFCVCNCSSSSCGEYFTNKWS
jgi:hypothetical protein